MNIVTHLKPHRARIVIVLALVITGIAILGAALIANRDQDHDTTPDSFSAQHPGVVYLAPADGFRRNLHLLDPASGSVVQLTASDFPIEDYAVSADGTQIAYSQHNGDGTIDLWVLDLDTRTTRPITRCVEAQCTAPAWSPDGTQIAFQRQDFNAGQGSGLGPSRAWIVALDTLAARLLVDDGGATLGQMPVWSPDGSRIAIHDTSLPGIRVVDVATGDQITIDTLQDVSGRFSPDGLRLVYPVLVRGLLGDQFYTHLALTDLATGTQTFLSGPEDAPVDDREAAWSPDGAWLAVTRRRLDQEYTPGAQLYLLDPSSGKARPLIVDSATSHSAPRWDSTGQRLIFQRVSLTEAGALPEIWAFDLTTETLERLAENAFLPAWIP